MPLLNSIKEFFISEKANVAEIVISPDFESRPIVPFKDQINHYKSKPQVKLAVDAKHVSVVGEDIIIKAKDKTVEKELNEYKEIYHLYSKIWDAEKMAAICGNQLIETVDDDLVLVDMQSIENIKFKEFEDGSSDGTVEGYIQRLDNGNDKLLPKEKFLHLPYDQINKGEWAISQCYPLFVSRRVHTDNGTEYDTKPLVDVMVQAEDAMGAIFNNMANPDKYITYPDANKQFIEDRAKQHAIKKPGEVTIGDRKPEIDIVETNPQGKYDSYVKHLDETYMMATGFSYEIFLGRFTSRASSETTETELTKMIQARKRFLCDWIKNNILIPYLLRKHQNLTQLEIIEAGIEVSFKDPNSVLLSAADVQAAAWATTEEKRKWARQHTTIQLNDDDPETPSDIGAAEKLLKENGYTVYERKRK